MQTLRVSVRPSFRLCRPPSLHHRSRYLDRRVDLELYMSLLFLCNGDSRAGYSVDQGSVFSYEMYIFAYLFS
ncbi:hypothetical protein M8C21_030890 [Ambrosia artemisiifolia]|uniref:Uncharacterized protein n=1 Tax=Ambrosia artemisiifolia TaxID=4212 RepID=A0AAD5GQV1_AMBAR|nr:hypothetical protein M8C21_030890 [Ambrosia artemisiifolia]